MLGKDTAKYNNLENKIGTTLANVTMFWLVQVTFGQFKRHFLFFFSFTSSYPIKRHLSEINKKFIEFCRTKKNILKMSQHVNELGGRVEKYGETSDGRK